MNSKDERSLRRYRFPASFMNASDLDFNEHPWQDYLGGANGRHDIKKWIPLQTHPKILNLGANWLEAMVYKEHGYDCTHVVMSTQGHQLLIDEGFKSLNLDMCEMLDVDNCSFDGLISVQALEHVFYPWKAILEMYRVLRDGGRVVLNVPQFHTSELDKDVPAPDVANLQHVSCLQTYQMRFMMRQSGFKVLEHEIPDGNQQTLYCEKMSYDDIVNYPPNDPLAKKYYRKQTAEFLKEYCEC
jgi:SAM-dependent methyltransferase